VLDALEQVLAMPPRQVDKESEIVHG
jgi:hypothetical protein